MRRNRSLGCRGPRAAGRRDGGGFTGRPIGIGAIALLVGALCLGLARIAGAAGEPPAAPDLTEIALEDLMNIEVTSVSKKGQRLSETASAVTVITGEEIRRSGATSIADALRMVPGLSVAQIDASRWAISSRGFNGAYANKILVLIDGRTVYTPIFSGVYWDLQDLVLEDIDRIEVIRGPGATVWGANAVNGVINILTKAPSETQGTLATGGSGAEEPGFGSIRHGGRLSASGNYRAYVKYVNRDSYIEPTGDDAPDEWDALRGGLRADWSPTSRDSLALEGNLYDVDVGLASHSVLLSPPYSEPVDVRTQTRGGNTSARWRRAFEGGSSASLQLFYDWYEREDQILHERLQTFDQEFQHSFRARKNLDVIWGFGYRHVEDQIGNTFEAGFLPDHASQEILNAFVQGAIDVVPNRLELTLGSKVEHSGFAGSNAQPSARLVWTPSRQHTVWGAVSRAVRTPARAERSLFVSLASFPGQGNSTAVLTLLGDAATRSENLIAYEAGYRVEPQRNISLDVATFYNSYDHLMTTVQGTPYGATEPEPYTVIPLRFANVMDGSTWGAEVAATWNVSSRWKLSGGYAWFESDLTTSVPGDLTASAQEGDFPHVQAHLRSALNLSSTVECDAALYRVDDIPNRATPAYTRVDLRVGWRPVPECELSVVGQNLLDERHPEFRNVEGLGYPSDVQRTGYGKVAWRF